MEEHYCQMFHLKEMMEEAVIFEYGKWMGELSITIGHFGHDAWVMHHSGMVVN